MRFSSSYILDLDLLVNDAWKKFQNITKSIINYYHILPNGGFSL